MLIDVQLEDKAFRLHIEDVSINKGGPRRAGVSTMTQLIATNHRWLSGLMARVDWFGRRARRDVLDVRRLSDHLRRDMGFLDGNDPSGRHA